ncbi:putative Zn -C6 fungal-type DNA-binding domain [Rosellinia necatrix]|uniref:Putative Zn-C6 fungal-type DNA-binding domain n=1 Tax=Rosellinia necatrix TaxID=77044 RepID=A0A1W2TN28_ROSNE|nr:putative Zn -C6 fungal-type DNA-binding domain [Rosellinia necatrix]
MSSPQRPEQSIRSSCDRCRSSKLKCVSSSSQDPSAPCQRCIRAKATCIFGQRARNKRGPRRSRQSMSPAAEEWHQEVPRGETPSSASSSSLTTPSSSVGLQASLPEPSMMPAASLMSDLESAWRLNNVLALSDANTDMSEWGEESWTIGGVGDGPGADTLSSIWADANIPITTTALVPHFPISQPPTTPFGISPSESLEFGEIILQTVDPSTCAKKDFNQTPMDKCVSPQLELSALLGEMQRYLHMLKLYYVSDSRLPEEALNNYPIGEALYLLQRFCELQGRIREVSQSPTWTQSAVDPDMVASLVIVTCYITMMRISYTLFCHLEHYLTQMSSESAARARTTVPGHCRTLRLGELTPVNDVCVRTREAVGTLLNALRSMDSAIGTPREDAWPTDDSDDMMDTTMTGSRVFGKGLAVDLLREEHISNKIDEEKERLGMKISQVEGLLGRQLNPPAEGRMVMA